MKTFTLEFINPDDERQFQNAKFLGVEQPVYKWLIICAIGYEFAGAIQSCIVHDQNKAKLPFIIGSLLLLQLIISIKYPQTLKVNQIISVYIALMTIFDISTANTIYDYYLYGATVQLWQCCIITMCGFKHSLHLIVITTFFRLSIPIYYTTSDYRDTFGAIVCAITFLVQNYLTDKIVRSQFLLSKKDLRWQQYMPSIIEKPYFIFEYNEMQRSFVNIEQQLQNYIVFNKSENSTLRSFLRDAQIENQTLELYLYENYLTSHAEESNIDVIYQRKSVNIKLYDLNIQNNQYLLIIDIHKVNNQPKQQVNYTHLFRYAQFVKKNMIFYNTKKQIHDKAHKTKTQITNCLFLSSINLVGQQIVKIEFTKMIFKLSKMYNSAYQTNIRIISNSAIKLNSLKSQVFAFMNYMFLLFHQQYSKQSYNIRVIIFEDSELELICLQVCLPNVDVFLEGYNKLSILKQLELKLLQEPVCQTLKFKFIRDMQSSFYKGQS